MIKHNTWEAVTILALLALSNSTRADQPPYMLLWAHRPSVQIQPPPQQPPMPAAGLAAPASAYSYGWFGSQPRKHWSRHFGYYRNFTQWKK